MEVINALMRNTIDLKRATLIIRALHIAVKNAVRVKYNVHSQDMVTEIPEYNAPPVDLDDAETSEADLPYSAFLPPPVRAPDRRTTPPRQQGPGMARPTGRNPRQPGTRCPNRCRWRNEKCKTGSCGNECRCGDGCRCEDECGCSDECRCGVRSKCGDGRLRPSSERSERATRSHNHDRQSSRDTRRSNPTSRFPESSAARRSPTKPAPARAPLEAWESRTQLRTQAARNLHSAPKERKNAAHGASRG
jgi:hypothetical protein